MKSNNALKLLVQEAISSLNNNKISTLTVSKVVGDKTYSDIKVYIFLEDFNQKEVLKELKKASITVKNIAFISSGWSYFPKITFILDNSYNKEQRMQKLFEKIKTN